MTRVMFTGTHGTGKSETCIKLNKALPDYLYIPSFAGPVAKRVGFDINRPHSQDQLMAYQERVLDTFIESYKITSFVDTIYDRSPNDIAAYTIFGVKEYNHRVDAFVKKCLKATVDYCDVLIYPASDLKEPMKNKYNRPTDIDRVSFDKKLDQLASEVSSRIKVIDVPVEYQYDDRVNYILERLKVECPKSRPRKNY